MTPDQTTGTGHDSDRDKPRQRRQTDGHHHSDGHHHGGTTAKSPQSPSAQPQRRSADGHQQRHSSDRGQDAAKEQEDRLSEDRDQDSPEEDREQESTEEPEQDSTEDREQDSSEDREQDSSGGASKRRTAAWAITAVRSQFPELAGRSVEQVTGVDKGDDSTWTVGVEVLEMRMVPDTADVLAQYEVQVDQDGDIVGYKRKRRYLRGRADD